MTIPFLADRRTAQRSDAGKDRRRRPRTRPHAPSATVRLSLGMINRCVMVVDAAVVVGVALLYQWAGQMTWSLLPTRPMSAPMSLGQMLIAAVVAAASFVVVVQVWDGYRVERYRRPAGQAFDLTLGLLLAAGADRLMVWTFMPEVLNADAWLSIWFAATALGLGLGRWAMAGLIQRFRAQGLLRRRVAIVGSTPQAHRIVAAIRQEDWHREFELVGLFDDGATTTYPTGSLKPSGDIAALRRLAQTSRIDLIVLASPWTDTDRLFDLGERVQWISADVVTPLEQPGFLARSSVLTQVAGIPTLQLTRHPFKGTQGLVKLVQDRLVATLGLILVSPILIVAAIAVRLSGEGPVLFRQDRIGFNGRPFSIYKFRTMSVDADDDGAAVARRDNPRITRVGAILRRTSIDELPQLLNVLRGEMSIVGPRPHVANMQVGDGPYVERVRSYAARHQIKPGITGWAQINGMRGGIDSVDKAARGVDLDLYYMHNWSLQLDLRIMVRTLILHMAGPQVF